MTIMLRALPALALMLGCDQASELQAMPNAANSYSGNMGAAVPSLEGVTGAQGNVGPPLDDIGKRLSRGSLAKQSRKSDALDHVAAEIFSAECDARSESDRSAGERHDRVPVS